MGSKRCVHKAFMDTFHLRSFICIYCSQAFCFGMPQSCEGLQVLAAACVHACVQWLSLLLIRAHVTRAFNMFHYWGSLAFLCQEKRAQRQKPALCRKRPVCFDVCTHAVTGCNWRNPIVFIVGWCSYALPWTRQLKDCSHS